MELSDFSSLANFTAIDFETAHGQSWSICQVGLVVVENGEIVKEFDFLVQPPGNQYHWGNTRVHGISRKTTANAPFFPEIWPQIKPYLDDRNIVAHNAPFDCGCLQKTLGYYRLPEISFRPYCTVKIYKKNLAALCQLHGIALEHHNALSDARACALLFLKHLQNKAQHEYPLPNAGNYTT